VVNSETLFYLYGINAHSHLSINLLLIFEDYDSTGNNILDLPFHCFLRFFGLWIDFVFSGKSKTNAFNFPAIR